VLSKAGDAYCWGDNRHGELGTGTFDNSLGPAAVATSGTWQEISARGHTTCGIKLGGGVQCWGSSGSNLFEPPTLNGSTSPVDVVTGAPFSRLIVGTTHACGLTVLVRVACWGTGFNGEIGNSFLTATPVPLPVLP
jgi:alpha-tubulin suppressor-like RCC1 family protein